MFRINLSQVRPVILVTVLRIGLLWNIPGRNMCFSLLHSIHIWCDIRPDPYPVATVKTDWDYMVIS